MKPLPDDVYYYHSPYRVVKTKKGTYRIQVLRKRSLLDILKRRPKWLSLLVDYDNPNKAKVKIVIWHIHRYYEMKEFHRYHY